MDTKALRQKILDLAIRGKLVPQDPNDEPAEVLLERIREQKQQMFKEGKLKKKDIKNDTIIFKGEDNLHYEKFADGTVKCMEDEIPFEVPEGWAWCKLNDIYNFIDYRGATPTKITNGIPLVTAKNVKSGYIDYTIDDYISEEEFKERQQRGISKKGDILFTTEAPLGNAALADMEKFSAGQRLITFQQYGSKNELINYVMLMFILSDFFQQQLYVKSTHNRRERPVYGHCGWSRGRFYYRITTFEGRPWDARDPHKTTFMALKHAIRLSIWRKQKETPGVEKAPGVSLPQRKESGRSGRDDGELRFGVRPGHPRKAVTSISQAEALAHGLTHLHHLVFAAVLARELDWCAALQDAREDARPWGVVGIGLRSDVWVEVRRDNHRPAVLVTRVDDVVDMPHDVIGAAVRPQVVDDEEVILEEARLRLLALVERHRLDVGHDVLHAGLQRGEPEVDDPVGDCRGIERLTCAHLSPEEQPIHVIA